LKFSSAEKINNSLRNSLKTENKDFINISTIGYYLALIVLFLLGLGRFIDFTIKLIDYLKT